MRATLKQILEGEKAMQQLLNAKLPVKAAYAVSKLAKACSTELEEFHRQRVKLFTDAGCTADENAKKFVHADGEARVNEIALQAEELIGAEVEFNALPLDIEQFGAADVPGDAFLGLDWAMKA